MPCKRCGSCCRRYPCALLPEDVKPIARFLNLSVEELVRKYLVIDYWCGGQGEMYYLCPGRKDERGRIASFGFAFPGAACVFFTDAGECQIHPVKPHNGRFSACGYEGRNKNKLWYARRWKHQIQKYLEMLD